MTPTVLPPATARHPGLLLVALYESTKGLLFVLGAVSLLRMLNSDLQAIVTHWAHLLRLNAQNRLVAQLLERVGLINPHELVQLSILGFFLGGLHLTQGLGLYLGKRWAEYLTVVATATFIPWEVYELCRHVTIVRALVLLGNVALVVYLASLLRRERKGHGPAEPLPPPTTS